MLKHDSLTLSVTTVERTVLTVTDVQQVTIPTQAGIITVLPNHVPLMIVLGEGELVIQSAGGSQVLYIEGGVGQIVPDRVEILAHQAERAEDLDTAKIEEAKRRAEQLLKDRPVDVDLAKVEASLRREVAKLKLAKKNQTAF